MFCWISYNLHGADAVVFCWNTGGIVARMDKAINSSERLLGTDVDGLFLGRDRYLLVHAPAFAC
jgi:hypothetical protein